MSFNWGCNIKIEEQMSGLRSREEIVTESFMLISNQHQNNRATRYSHVLGGEITNSLGNIYSQDVPTGRPGTSLYDVLQSF